VKRRFLFENIQGKGNKFFPILAKKDKSGLKNRKQLLFYPARLMKQ